MMCNLSLGVVKDTREKAEIEFAEKLLLDKIPYEIIVKYTGLTIKKIEKILSIE